MTTIGAYAFDGCYEQNDIRYDIQINRLQQMVLPSGITVLENYAFFNSGYIAIILPDTLEEVGDYAFKNCPYLEKITGLKKVTRMGKDICLGARKLQVPGHWWEMP